jgi:hypothetical protein
MSTHPFQPSEKPTTPVPASQQPDPITVRLDELLQTALDAHATGHSDAALAAWSQIEALGPAALSSAKRTQQALTELRTMRMPVDLTDRVLARLEAAEAPPTTPARAASPMPTPHAPRLGEMVPRAPARGRRRLPRLSGTMIASLLAIATVGGLMIFARPNPQAFTNAPALAGRTLSPRPLSPAPDLTPPVPGAHDQAATDLAHLTLGDTSRYDKAPVGPLVPWGTWSPEIWASERVTGGGGAGGKGCSP